MKLLLTAASVILAFAATANATLLEMGTQVSPDGDYELSASEFTTVGTLPSGNDLLAVTLTLTNLNPDANFNVNNIAYEIGTNGSLHNEVAFGGFARFPSAQSWLDFDPGGNALSPVDSFALPAEGGFSLEAPTEAGDPDGTGILGGSAGASGSAGFGVSLSGNYSLTVADTGASQGGVDVFYLTFEDLGADIEVDFSITPSSNSGIIATPLVGAIVGIPEPSAMILCGLALVGFAARRQG